MYSLKKIYKKNPDSDSSASTDESPTERYDCKKAFTSPANAITKVPVSNLIITL